MGYSVSNIGVGPVPSGGSRFAQIIEDYNPADPMVDDALNMPVLSASTMPSSGTFMAGAFVRNENARMKTDCAAWMGPADVGIRNVSGTD